MSEENLEGLDPNVDVPEKEIKASDLADEIVDENPFEEFVAGDGGDTKIDVEEDDVKVIGSVVDKKLTPMQRELQQTRIELQMDRLLNSADGEAYKPFVEKIKKYAADPRLKDLSFKAKADLAVGTAFWKRKGAEEERRARAEARESESFGSGARLTPISNVPDFDKMSRQEFADYQERIISNR